MTLVKEIIEHLPLIKKELTEFYRMLHACGIDLFVIALLMSSMEIIKKAFWKDVVYKYQKYHKRRLKIMILTLFILSIILSVLVNYKYYNTMRLYQIIVFSFFISASSYEAVKWIIKQIKKKIQKKIDKD
jgi:hypothetical protein